MLKLKFITLLIILITSKLSAQSTCGQYLDSDKSINSFLKSLNIEPDKLTRDAIAYILDELDKMGRSQPSDLISRFKKPHYDPDPYIKPIPTVPEYTYSNGLKNFLKLDTHKIDNIKYNLEIINTVTKMSATSNIRPTSTSGLGPITGDLIIGNGLNFYYVMDLGSQMIIPVNVVSGVELNPISLTSFFRNFQTESAFFPFAFDLNNPKTLVFGVGARVRNNNGALFEDSLKRNGGHFQLAQAYKRSLNPILDGLYGGGLSVSGNSVTIEFKSRGLNTGSNGHLPEEEETILRQLMDDFRVLIQESI